MISMYGIWSHTQYDEQKKVPWRIEERLDRSVIITMEIIDIKFINKKIVVPAIHIHIHILTPLSALWLDVFDVLIE